MFILEVPLNCQGWVNEELFIVIGVINEVVANLNLGTYTEMLGGIVPQLRLGKENQLTVTISLLSTPEINKTREGTLLIGKVQAPHTSKLNRIISTGIIVALKEALIHQLHRVGL